MGSEAEIRGPEPGLIKRTGLSIRRGFLSGVFTSWTLLKVMIPTMVVVQLLKVTGLLGLMAAAGAPLSLSDYQALSVPACLIAGKRSRAETQKITRLLAASITTCAYHEVDSGHMGPVSDPEAVNKLVYEFISLISPET